ncbi:VOC family protein [Mycobacteroides franklinii]|uniref:2-oxoadipate dioxygenase/decarboxylase n=1 Tax=Mycobacteroides franklinii TaxID=948102 RepID=UPI0009926586|nr:VOC family protein [Mycobacteroides franklinii]
MTDLIQPWELRARFAAALSKMYGTEVPAYNTLVDVSTAVNQTYAATHPDAERLGSVQRVTAERHGAIRVGSPRELAAVADLFEAFGMYPVDFYDLRDAASPVPVVSTAFRPIDEKELALNPFRVFTSMLATADRRFFDANLRTRVENFVQQRELFDPALLAHARLISATGGCTPVQADDFITEAVKAFALSTTPIDRVWYDELSAVSPVAADIAGVGGTHINHLTPRVLDIDDLYRRMTARGITMIDAIQGPPRWHGPDVLLRQTSFRALAEPRRFRMNDGSVVSDTLRVRFGEVEARGIALTPAGRTCYDDAMAAIDAAQANPEQAASMWANHFPDTEAGLAERKLAYFRTEAGPGGEIVRSPVVYEDFLPRSAAGIFRSNLDDDGAHGEGDAAGYSKEWMSGAIGRDIHDPYALYSAIAAQSDLSIGANR